MAEQRVEIDGRSRLASIIELLPNDIWTDNEGDDFEDGIWYPALLQFETETLYDPISWALHHADFTDDELSGMTESEANNQMKILFGVNRHEVATIAQLTVGVSQEKAKQEIIDYLTNRG